MPQEIPETVAVNTSRVSCEGNSGALGHPRIWLEIGAKGFVECPYCSRRFELAPKAEKH